MVVDGVVVEVVVGGGGSSKCDELILYNLLIYLEKILLVVQHLENEDEANLKVRRRKRRTAEKARLLDSKAKRWREMSAQEEDDLRREVAGEEETLVGREM